MIQHIVNRYINFSTKLDRIFRILVYLILGFTLLFYILGRLLFPPDFKQFNSHIKKIEFKTMVIVNDSTRKMKSIIITNPEIIKVFCEDLRNYSHPKYFDVSDFKQRYEVTCYGGKDVLEMDLATTFKDEFIISILGNFGSTGINREYSNDKIRDFVDSKIKPLIPDSGVIP